MECVTHEPEQEAGNEGPKAEGGIIFKADPSD